MIENSKKSKWEQEYINKEVIDCPYCGHDRPDHSCGNCYSEISLQDCWQWRGYCSEKCLKYIKEELPRIRQEKINAGIKCLCDEPQCGKCLGGNCQDQNCFTHTPEIKLEIQKSMEPILRNVLKNKPKKSPLPTTKKLSPKGKKR